MLSNYYTLELGGFDFSMPRLRFYRTFVSRSEVLRTDERRSDSSSLITHLILFEEFPCAFCDYFSTG